MIAKNLLRHVPPVWIVLLTTLIVTSIPVWASENIPRKPFGQSATLPEPGQFVVTPWYIYTRWQRFWEGDNKVSIERINTDDFELNDGIVALEYGLNRDLALDLKLGYTSAATRFFDPPHKPQTTQGLMDVTFGVRYRLVDEAKVPALPTVTVRLGGIARGSYTPEYPFAPGDGASGVEPSVMITKTLCDCGFGVYGDFGWRVRDHSVPQAIFGSAGLSQTVQVPWLVQSAIFNVGYDFDRDLSGQDVHGTRTALSYDARVQEMNDYIQGGIGVLDHGGRRYQFYIDYNLQGRNTGEKLVYVVYGLYIDIPFGGK